MMQHSTTRDEKEIIYDRGTHDFAMYYEGELIGFAKTYAAAEDELNAHAHTVLSDLACDLADEAAGVL